MSDRLREIEGSQLLGLCADTLSTLLEDHAEEFLHNLHNKLKDQWPDDWTIELSEYERLALKSLTRGIIEVGSDS